MILNTGKKYFLQLFRSMSGKNDFSQSTKNLIARMMEEKNISRRRRKEISNAISVGGVLPVESKYI